MQALGEAQQALELIRQCLSGDGEAARQFQEAYGELIYGYPMRVYRTPPEDAGDFYVFAFEHGRIFRRLRTFEGRAPLRAYLLGFVLDDLVLEWKRGARHLETVSLDEMGDLPATAPDDGGPEGSDMDGRMLNDALACLDPSKAVLMKLLYIEDCELSAAELRHLACVSGRGLGDVLACVERLRAMVRTREARVKNIEDTLDAVQAWIELYRRRQQRVEEELAAFDQGSEATARLRDEQQELDRKLERRQHQRTKLVAQTKRRKVTAPYKEIAAILNTTVGNVGSQITRLRDELRSRGVPMDFSESTP